MQDVNLHIEYLLRYHDCVILPGVGAFLRSRRAACMDEATGALIPARRQVCFNSAITSDDGLLAHSICRREDIGFEQARIEVGYYCEAIRSALATDGETSLGRIGSLCMDADGVLSFIPRTTALFKAEPIMPRSITHDRPVATTEPESTHYYTFRIPRRVVRYAAMVAVVLMACFTLSIPVSDSTRVDNASVLPLPASTGTTAQGKVEMLVAKPEHNSTPARYYLIVGASRSMDKCHEFIARHPGHGLRMLNAGNNTLVYIASSDDRSMLVKAMRSADITDEFGQTWVYDIQK